MAQLLANQRQADKFTVFIAIADNGAARRRQGQHRHQLGLGAGFQANGQGGVGDHAFDHRFLLVDLDRVEQGVAVFVAEFFPRLIKAADDAAHPMLQNVRKAHQQGQRQAARAQVAGELVEIQRGVVVLAAWVHAHLAVVADIKIPGAPMANAVHTAAVCNGPSHE